MFQFPGWNSGRLCAGVRILDANAKPSFNSPVGILAVCAVNCAPYGSAPADVSIPRLEFWPFVPS